MSSAKQVPPQFDASFRARFAELVRWRRDVRRFRSDAVSSELIQQLLTLASHAPSVGFCQPWRFVLVESAQRRAAVIANFKRSNEAALAGYDGERRALYASLKLEGLTQAPVHLAVCADEGAATGHRLGRVSMPETLRYSVVAAIQTFWLAARAEGLGVGWVSIVDPAALCRDLDLPPEWSLIAYLCIGWPQEEHDDPELDRHGWETRLAPSVLAPLRR
ncbi:5,6-dimethylbenzimidazole synthase [Bradyrhizobium sp. HKCCYLRH3099]|uniref:5,6-dimethylbenzimidazole synthase n=1 Tax=unclassified Bradyrhizobium TaxID=2631580 RepID=UPI003EB924CD